MDGNIDRLRDYYLDSCLSRLDIYSNGIQKKHKKCFLLSGVYAGIIIYLIGRSVRSWGRTAFGRMLVSGQRRPSKRTFFMTGNGGQRTPWTATVTSPSSPQPCWNLLIWSCQRLRPLWLVMVSWSSLTRTWEMCLGYLLGVGKSHMRKWKKTPGPSIYDQSVPGC